VSNHNRFRCATSLSVNADRAQVQPARNRGPAGVSTVAALTSSVCINGMSIAAATVAAWSSGSSRQASRGLLLLAVSTRPR
jgi:hypothetical protein